MEMIKIDNFTFTYPNSDAPALCEMSIAIEQSDFVVVCGQSGCGKTTLLRNLKREIAPHGTRSGNILYKGTDLEALEPKVSASDIGFVMQNPENQIVTDTVWHELAFGLENLGLPSHVIRRRVAETAHFFGINTWYEKSVFSLSGGQKQILNLAAVMTMQPKLIILDEPTAQLDPIAAKDFLTVLTRVNQELGTTVIMSGHRLEDVIPVADNVLYMEHGKTAFYGSTGEFIVRIAADKKHVFAKALPSAVQIASALGEKEHYPVTVREGRAWLKAYPSDKISTVKTASAIRAKQPEKPILQAKGIWARYRADDPFVLNGMSCDIYSGRITAIVGGNGSGKTTILSVLAGILKPVRGSVKLSGKNLAQYKGDTLYKNNIALLTQNPKTMFVCDTLYDDLKESADLEDKENSVERIAQTSNMLGLTKLLRSHPYDLSGGEQQKAAIGKLLLLKPRILLLDEPTKGIDVYAKEELAKILQRRSQAGDAVVIVTHDVEFAAKYADECMMVFNGEVICRDSAKDFFVGNNFYTTSAHRISRGVTSDAVTPEEVIELCENA